MSFFLDGATSWDWLLLLLDVFVFVGIVSTLTGWSWFKTPQYSRYRFTPARVNVRGLHVYSHQGLMQVDAKKGLDVKHNLLFLKGRKEPLPNARCPDMAKCMEADPEATLWPESFEAMLLQDPRGRMLRYVPPRASTIQLLRPGFDGVQIVSRDVVAARAARMSRDLQDINTQEQIENASLSSFERIQQMNALTEDYAKAQSSLFQGFLASTQKQRG